MTGEELRQCVADSIRAIAEYVIENADDYAVGMDDAKGLRILMEFEVNSIPEVVVEKTINAHHAIMNKRCRIWTRFSEDEK